MAFYEDLTTDLDGYTAAYLTLLTQLGVVRTRINAQRDTVDDREESASWLRSLVGIDEAVEKLTLESLTVPDGVADSIITSVFSPILDGAEEDAVRNAVANSIAGVTSLTGYLSSYNYGAAALGLGTYWNALQAPDFGQGLYKVVNAGALEARNVYSPAIANMGSRVIGAGFVDGSAVDTAKYAGAAILNLVASGITGSGQVVVTGSGRSSTGATVTNRTWLANVAGNGTVTLAPVTTGDICTDVTGIEPAAGISAGTLQVACAIPSGRANPPV